MALQRRMSLVASARMSLASTRCEVVPGDAIATVR
jgi:hypothetical protein